MFFLLAIFLFILGLATGSFLNICIDRIPGKESKMGLPYCSHCHHSLKAWENIPLISYFILKGKCRYCSGAISLRYPLVEFIVGLLFLAVFLAFDSDFKTPVAFFFISVLVLLAVIDLKHRIIPNKVILPAFCVGLILILLNTVFKANFFPLSGVSNSVLHSLIGAGIGAGVLIIPALIKVEWMGGGDIKLAAFMGLFLGANVLLALFVGSLIAAITGIVLMFLGKLSKEDSIPFGPFLTLGGFAVLFLPSLIIYF